MEFEITTKTGDRYLVREPREEDLDEILEYITELVNERVFIVMDHVPSREEEKEWLENTIKDVRENRKIHWIVEKDGKIVGGIEARKGRMKHKHTVELGIALLKEARGKGLGKQLMQRLIDEIFKKWPDVKLIWLGVFSKNEPAKALYWKLGFRPVARLPGWRFHFGEYVDEEIWYWKDSPLVKELGIELE